MRSKFLIFSTIALLSACQVGEEYHQPNFVAEHDIQKNLNLVPNGKGVSRAWYEIFNDNDLNCLVSHALSNNLTVKQAVERLQQARLSLAIYSKENYPMLNASGGYDFSKASDHQEYAYDINVFKVGIDASWELDIWGKGKYITEQYYEFMHNYQYSLLDLEVSIAAEVTGNYINLREAQEKLRIAEHNLKLQRDILQTVRDKYDAGIADDLALNQAEYAVETTKSSIPPLKYEIESYKNALAVLLGVLPSALPIDLQRYKKNITAQTFPYKTSELYNLPLSIVRTRPDIMAAETAIKAQNAAVGEAIANLYPTVSLSATFGFISSSGHSLFNRNSEVYGYTPGLTMPIWHWGQLTNNVELQKHIKEEYILNYNEAMLTAVTELKNAISAVEQAYKTNTYRKNSFYKMQNVMTLTQEKYKNGMVDFTDVATAEQNLLAAQNALAASNAEILQYLTAFYKATGGGYNLR